MKSIAHTITETIAQAAHQEIHGYNARIGSCPSAMPWFSALQRNFESTPDSFNIQVTHKSRVQGTQSSTTPCLLLLQEQPTNLTQNNPPILNYPRGLCTKHKSFDTSARPRLLVMQEQQHAQPTHLTHQEARVSSTHPLPPVPFQLLLAERHPA
jgi:hypothetical protein